eukprot:4758232-Amphidinium_carterae.1
MVSSCVLCRHNLRFPGEESSLVGDAVVVCESTPHLTGRLTDTGYVNRYDTIFHKDLRLLRNNAGKTHLGKDQQTQFQHKHTPTWSIHLRPTAQHCGQ